MLREPLVAAVSDEGEGLGGVVVGGGEAVLRREAVLDGGDDGGEGGGGGEAEVVEHGGGGAGDDEAASVEEHDEWKLRVRVRVCGCSREEQAEPGVVVVVDGEVFGEDGEGGVVGGSGARKVAQPSEGAVRVENDVDVVVGVDGLFRHGVRVLWDFQLRLE